MKGDTRMKLLLILIAASLALGSSKECKVTKMGLAYRGKINVTSSGLACQKWNSDYPHRHSNKKTNRPNAGLDSNYCRNPDRESEGPWCYTVSRSKRYEFCDIPLCSDLPKCERKIDVVILFEMENGNPGSISNAKDFLQTLKQTIKPSLKCIRLEFILIWSKVEILTNLNCEYDSGSCYSDATRTLTNIRNKASRDIKNTKVLLPKAIAIGQQHLFSKKNGARSDATKVMLLVLNNPPVRGLMPTQDAVKDLQDMGVKIVTIGSADGRNEDLFRISLNPRNIFKFDTLDGLSESNVNKIAVLLKSGVDSNSASRYLLDFALQNLHQQLELPRNLIFLKDATRHCMNKVDIGFLIDASGSLKNDYTNEKFFVQRMTSRFGLSEAGSRAGVIVFSSRNYVETAIQFNQYSKFRDFKTAVDKLPFHGHLTRIDLALTAANEELFTKAAGSRENVAKILFLITDGRQNPDFENGTKLSPSEEAEKLLKRGIKIFTIGVGKKINETELSLIARLKDRVFMVDDFTQLTSDEFVKRVSKKSCDEAFIPPTGEAKQNDTKVVKDETPQKNGENKKQNKQTEKAKPSKGICCGANRKPPTYANVFNEETNINYLLQQSKIGQVGHKNSIDNVGFDLINSRKKLSKMSTKQINEVLKKLLPEEEKLLVKKKDDETIIQIN